ncbi:hypothetical protein [Streptomyces sp. NPDC096132]|uniref:hypothetical protein n=1 Tax=Streptomyces sp. NPDC096132 TaxID=3366075 RepID=UPI00381A24A0
MPFAPRAGGALSAITLALGLATLPTPAHAAPIACDEVALVAAVNAANQAGGGVIDLAPNCVYTLDTVAPAVGGNGPNGLPVITERVTINGSNAVIERAADPTTPNFRLFEVGGADGRLTLDRITLRNGHLGDELGGAVLVNNDRGLFVDDSTLTGNHAHEGGAIAAVGVGHATISGSTVSDNTVDWGGGGVYGGGLTIRSTTVSGNKAHHAGGVHSLGTLLMQSSTVRNNSAEVAGGVYNAGTGTITGSGVQDNTAGTAGGVFNLTGSLTVDHSTIHGNTATVEGGGLHNYDGTLDVDSSILWANKVTATDSRGGGLYNGTGTATLTRSFVVGNRAVLEGGGIFETPGSTVDLVNSFVFANTPDNCRPPRAVPGCTG